MKASKYIFSFIVFKNVIFTYRATPFLQLSFFFHPHFHIAVVARKQEMCSKEILPSLMNEPR